MNFDLSEDQRTIKSTARQLLAARYPPAEVRRLALEDERGFTDEQWAEMVELGWPGIPVPEEQGGQGLGVVELAVVAEELGYALAPTPLQSTWATALLLAAAGRADVLNGGRRGTVAQWDDDAGHDPSVSSLRPDGTRLTGTKVVVPDAHAADVLVVTAAEGRHFLLDASAVSVEPARGIDATRRPSTVRLSGAAAEELGGGDFDRAWHAIAVMAAAESVGVGERTLEMAVAYAKERRQFDRPIGSYQAVSHACAQMLLEVEGARSVVYWAAWALDAEPETAPLAAACAKAYASDAGARVARSALQVHGGIGFTWEHDLHFFLKRAEVNARAYGDARWQRDRVAELAGL